MCFAMKALQYHVHKLSKEKSVYNRFSQCSTITSTEFAIFVLDAKHFNTLAIYCGKHYNIRIHTMARGHTLCTISKLFYWWPFPYISYGEWEGTDPQRGLAIITWSNMQVAYWIPNVICPEYTETCFASYISFFLNLELCTNQVKLCNA